MKKVLIPVDGSECSLRAVDRVIAKRSHYADPNALEIHLVNVQSPLSHDVSRFFNHDQIAGFHHEESDKQMQEACKHLDAAGAKYTRHEVIGTIAEKIAELADSLQCDQVVMGTHGRGALAEVLMGSITLKIIHLVNIPILLVK
jgi:nucleotide-binding universal stress UspA family protein